MTQGLVRSHQSSLAALYRLLDAVLILSLLAFWCAYFGLALSKDWLVVGLIGAGLFAFFAESVELYRSWRADSYAHMLGLTLVAWCSVCAVLMLVGYFTKEGVTYSRLVVGWWFTSTLVVLAVWRYVFRILLFHLRSRDHNTRSAVILGVTGAGVKLAKDIAAEPQHGIRVRGFYSTPVADDCTELPTGLSVLGDVKDAVAAARVGEFDMVYIALPLREEVQIAKILSSFADTTATVHLVTDLFFENLLHTRWYHVGGTNLLSLYDTPIEGVNGWVKRGEDILLASAILLLVSPFMLLIALGIRLTSPGPVIFKQLRYGLDGRPIKVWKFRSMTTQENGSVVVQARRNDARVTSFGRFLRSSSLDELPQFINVLQGKMSIVGPRPHAVAHNEEYRAVVDGYMLRHKVKPGITGWAQVNGWRGETETIEKMNRRIEHDLHYIRHWSLWLDLKILALTAFRGFTGKNAY